LTPLPNPLPLRERGFEEGTERLRGEQVVAIGLLDSDGLWWVLSHLVENFVTFPPLGLVLVGLLGIGLAKRSGLLPVLLRRLWQTTPAVLLDPLSWNLPGAPRQLLSRSVRYRAVATGRPLSRTAATPTASRS
jgi:hypothetical protein